MPSTHLRYPPEYRQQIVELVRAGRSPEELAREFEATAQTIRNWIKQADLDDGCRHDGLTAPSARNLPGYGERTSNFALSAKSWQKPPPGSHGRPARSRPGLRVREGESGQVSCGHDPAPAVWAGVCRVLGVSTSGYYAWLKRRPSQRSREDAVLAERIHWIHLRSRGTYGTLRIHAELCDEGVRMGCKRVARLMQAAGLQGVSRRKHTRTTVRQAGARPAPDLVKRHFAVARPNELWVADITYISTWTGFLYLAVVVDAWSRRVLGWATLAPAV